MEYIADVDGVEAFGAICSPTLLDIANAVPWRRVGWCLRIASRRFVSVSHDEESENTRYDAEGLFLCWEEKGSAHQSRHV